MKIYDISQEVFGCAVFPGDPAPKREVISDMNEGALYNLTVFSMCAHNGTHVDAPRHFYKDGKTLSDMPLDSFIGSAFVHAHEGDVSAADADEILRKASGCKHILIKGKATVTPEAAQVFAESDIRLLGNESQTVGPESAPMAVHLTLLKKEIVLLEGIRLSSVPEGTYLLNAAPIHLGGCDGAPCRAVLIEL